MKKIFLSVIFGVLATMGIVAQDFNDAQLALRLGIVEYLSEEGFQPKIDQDGDVRFRHKDLSYYFIINEDWDENPLLVTLYLGFSYDDTFTREKLEKCIPLEAKYKVVKLYCSESSYSYRSDVFCKDAEVLKSTFYSVLAEINALKENVDVTVNSGLSDIGLDADQDEVFKKAMEYYYDDDYDQSYPLFKHLAENGYAPAYGYMGLAYELGEGTSRDEDLMETYFIRAIDNGSYWCAYRLGNYYYENGDYDAAMDNYLKCGANENGFQSEALYKAGKMYEEGVGRTKDLARAVICYKKSVQHASMLGCDARLALMRLGEEVESKEDFVEATKTMLAGMTPEEMYEEGEQYEYGRGGRDVSLTKAYAYFKAAADRGNAEAMGKMGEIYVSEFYPFNDKSKSDKYYSKALKAYKKMVDTDGNACYEIGYMYQNGLGVDKDLGQAKYYYKEGALLGDNNAAWRLGLIYKNEMEYTDAYNFLLKAADGGQGMAMFELAKLFESGLGTSYSKEKAIEWYKRCVESNYRASDDAKEALKRLGVEGY